jgi:hypothetical protein
MRLLQRLPNGDVRLTDFSGATPAYAILSHTWEGEEVLYDDMVKGRGQEMKGYAKIKFCQEQAVKDGLEYFWVDTCCINKASSAELSEAINSAYEWYAGAAKCYVYLSDMQFAQRPNQLSRCRWFTRGKARLPITAWS